MGESTLRIIGGTLGGRRIVYHGDRSTRPMKDRVREAMFSLLGPERCRGKHVVDLFAGTGAIAFEALSRGALHASVFECNFMAAKVLVQNAESLEIADRVACTPGDTFIWAPRARFPADVPWLVFCSPPYQFYLDEFPRVQTLIEHLIEAAPAQSVCMVESSVDFEVAQLPQPDRWQHRTYAPAQLSWLETATS